MMFSTRSRSFLAAVALLMAGPVGRWNAAAEGPANPKGPCCAERRRPTDRTAEGAIEAALAEPSAIEFVDTPLEDALRFLGHQHRVPVYLDRRALDDEGIAPGVPVTARRGRCDLATALDEILKPLDLAWQVRCEHLFITTKSVEESWCEPRVYQVLRLTAFDELVQDLIRNIDPESWCGVGGPGSLAALPPAALVIAQTQCNHRAIERHYAGWLRRVRVPHAATVPGLVHRAVAKALSEPTTVEFVETPLEDVASFLEAQHEVEFLFDARALDDVGLARDVPVTLSLERVCLRHALCLLLSPLDLTWVPDKNAIRITTPEAAEIELVGYRVDDLVQRFGAAALQEAICQCVAPDTWETVGGAGSIHMGVRGTLDVRQTYHVHQQIAQLLAALRQTLRAAKPAGGPQQDKAKQGAVEQ